MVRITGEELQKRTGYVRAEARLAPVEVTYHGRPELVILSVEAYARLRRRQKLAHTLDTLPGDVVHAIAGNRMDAEHAHLNALMDD